MRSRLVFVGVLAVMAVCRAQAVALPDTILEVGVDGTNVMRRVGNVWQGKAAQAKFTADGTFSVTGQRPVSFFLLRWHERLDESARVLGDAWERTYGDVGWKPPRACALMPWYFLVCHEGRTDGWGVKVQPNALCAWRLTADGVELVVDVRAGARPVRLNGRELSACTVVRRSGVAGETPWQAGRAFCREMCSQPRRLSAPVYGYNDWYCAYGRNTATNFLKDAKYIVDLTAGLANRPFVVVDDGWEPNSPPVSHGPGEGPWNRAGCSFGMEMKDFAAAVTALGAKPGLWYRPLGAWAESPDAERDQANAKFRDPTVPAVRDAIAQDIARFRAWGFKLLKIDYLTYDITRLWGFEYGDDLMRNCTGWRDDTRTTAEVMGGLYRVMREAAGDDLVIIGCNALNHLAAGLFELQRIGDDTSGQEWARTLQMGVNTLAFRSIQDGVFFAADADCVGLERAGAVPWEKNRQWLELVAASGTPLFVSWRRQLATDEVRAALRDAFRLAAEKADTAQPIDWMETCRPTKWRLRNRDAVFGW